MSVSRMTNAPTEGLILGVKTKKKFLVTNVATAFTNNDLPPVLVSTPAAAIVISAPAPDTSNEEQVMDIYNKSATAGATVQFQSPAGTAIGSAVAIGAKGEFQVQNGVWVRLV